MLLWSGGRGYCGLAIGLFDGPSEFPWLSLQVRLAYFPQLCKYILVNLHDSMYDNKCDLKNA